MEVETFSVVVLKKFNSFLKELWHFEDRALASWIAARFGEPEAIPISRLSHLQKALVGELLLLIWV